MHTEICTKEKGSLLIETLVAFAILAMVVVAVVSSFTILQRANRGAEEDLSTMQALMFALDDITREFQVSDHIQCVDGATNGTCNEEGITMKRRKEINNQTADNVTFALNGDTLQKTIGGAANLTPSTVEVQTFTVRIYGNAANDKEPTRLLITLVAKQADTHSLSAPITLQTTLTSRFE